MNCWTAFARSTGIALWYLICWNYKSITLGYGCSDFWQKHLKNHFKTFLYIISNIICLLQPVIERWMDQNPKTSPNRMCEKSKNLLGFSFFCFTYNFANESLSWREVKNWPLLLVGAALCTKSIKSRTNIGWRKKPDKNVRKFFPGVGWMASGSQVGSSKQTLTHPEFV